MIKLRIVDEENFNECLNLSVNVEDENWVDSVMYSLAEAWIYYKDTKPFAIYEEDKIIGFISMYVGEENHQIINFLIDDAYRRKGYGTKAAKLCIEYLQDNYQTNRISAPVNIENIPAQNF